MPTQLKRSMHEELFWRTRLNVAFRTAWGCFMAGLILQLGNMHVQWTTFPVFSYVMAVTVVGESTFGRALQDTVGVLVGTIQGIGMAMLVLQLLGPERMTLGLAILCISLSSFVIVYPRNVHILSKRVALAHSAILYIMTSLKKADMDIVYFPLQLAGTTVVGATCGMLAILLPFPHLAIFQVQSQAKLSTRIMSERLRVMVDAFCIDDGFKAPCLNIQAKALANMGSMVDAEIDAKENDMRWELSSSSRNLNQLIKCFNRLQKNLVGMQLALTSELSSPSKKLLHRMLKDCLIYLTDWACLALRHASADEQNWGRDRQLIIDEGDRALAIFNEELSIARQTLSCMTTSEIGQKMHTILGQVLVAGGLVEDREMVGDAKQSFQSLMAALFFLFSTKKFVQETKEILSNSEAQRQAAKLEHCGKFLTQCPEIKYIPQMRDINVQVHIHSVIPQDTSKTCKYCNNTQISPCSQEVKNLNSKHSWFQGKCSKLASTVNAQQLRAAFKMSLAMAIGAFMGSWFNLKKGYWADITLGLGFAGASQGGSFKIANLRAQGTVAGSIYGLLVALATIKVPFLRMVALIPWVVFTSFLRQSKLYGYAGAVSAFTGAIVILAHTNKDASDQDFTVVRIVEAFLGMTSFIAVDMLVMPRRAASMVEPELVLVLGNLKAFTAAALSAYSSGSRCHKCSSAAILVLKEKERKFKTLMSKQKSLVKEAAEEPQFWFTPFPANIFSKIMNAQARMADLLHFSLCSFETILQVSENAPNVIDGPFGSAVKVVEERIFQMLECLEQALQVKTNREVSKVNVNKLDEKTMNGAAAMPGGVQSRLVELKGLTKIESTALDSKGSLLDIGPTRLKQFTERFETNFHGMVGGEPVQHSNHAADQTSDPYMETVSNTVLLSLGAMSFSLQQLLQETCELEKAIHELLQFENPWNLVNLSDMSS